MEPEESQEFVLAVRRKLFPSKRDDEAIPGKDVAYLITSHVAWQLRGFGWRLVHAKPGSQNNHKGYTTDIIAKPSDGFHIDVLGDSGGGNYASWNPNDDPDNMAAVKPRVESSVVQVEDIFTGDDSGTSPAPPADTFTKEECQKMIDEAVKNCIKRGDKVGLRSNSGMLLCAEGGGPEDVEEDFWLRSREKLGAWEQWKLEQNNSP